jgi:hypothetical protein
MAKPLDDDFNYSILKPSPITEGGISLVQPKVSKGGVFAPADIALIKRALDVYRDKLVQAEESERTPSAELSQLANLMHRLNNRI